MSDVDDRTLYCGNLEDEVTEELVYELFLQAGPVERITLRNSRNKKYKKYAFVTFKHDVSVPYAIKLFRGTTLFQKELVMQPRGRMAQLPSPIRFGPVDEPIDSASSSNQPPVSKEEAANETGNLQKKRKIDNKPVTASSQSNTTHRHHPYYGKQRSHGRYHGRGQYKSRSSWKTKKY